MGDVTKEKSAAGEGSAEPSSLGPMLTSGHGRVLSQSSFTLPIPLNETNTHGLFYMKGFALKDKGLRR